MSTYLFAFIVIITIVLIAMICNCYCIFAYYQRNYTCKNSECQRNKTVHVSKLQKKQSSVTNEAPLDIVNDRIHRHDKKDSIKNMNEEVKTMTTEENGTGCLAIDMNKDITEEDNDIEIEVEIVTYAATVMPVKELINQKPEKTVGCGKCKKMFVNESAMRTHMNRIHINVPLTSTRKSNDLSSFYIPIDISMETEN